MMNIMCMLTPALLMNFLVDSFFLYIPTAMDASIFGGLIGPVRSFADAILIIAFTIGAGLLVPTWYLAERYPKS